MIQVKWCTLKFSLKYKMRKLDLSQQNNKRFNILDKSLDYSKLRLIHYQKQSCYLEQTIKLIIYFLSFRIIQRIPSMGNYYHLFLVQIMRIRGKKISSTKLNRWKYRINFNTFFKRVISSSKKSKILSKLRSK